tara:strand:+ start:80 stop:277 length:198 start_codon:yes stop_codon:yes gene_type:complete
MANNRRFRASIYVDIIVPESDDLEKDRAKAEWIVGAISKDIRCENYVGGVAHKTNNLLKPLDREI